MRRTGYLYEKVMTLENIIDAWELFNARRAPKLRRLVDVVKAQRILDRMKNDFAGVIGKPRIKYIRESGKLRRLQIPPFESVIAQTAIWNICGKYVENRIHSQSFSSRKGMGGHLAARKCEKFVHTHKDGDARYCFYFDVRKYYQHIDKRILMSRIETVFKDKRIIEMFRVIIYSAEDGLPIGYPFSHALANLYLVPLYFLIRSTKGVSKVYVYMDNWLVFSKHKKPLHRAKVDAEGWLERMGCSLKPEWQIFPTRSRGVRICGFIVFANSATRLYRGIWRRLLRNFRRFVAHPTRHRRLSLMSRLGWLKAINQEYNPIFTTPKGDYLWNRG